MDMGRREFMKPVGWPGQSEVAVEAIKEYLDRHEAELEKNENPLKALA